MPSLVDLFISKGWNTDLIGYAGMLITGLVLIGIYRYLSSDDSENS
ncbi:hypothetical protein [Neptuniibacter caesariensis]|uniref:DUF3149 domain-containing protein n=1 Tax=Neptuniibacter caesariensis TaxID=207954 RepID=A0A7U8GTW4_NEPCE|nr:hypothetical protein [Neptuniibacter caesariensis]EAR62758.1 hypothetical protein MED92_06553 [Oceanospirillum sp. MED92] [Neptuniibacter caesariensis]